jgi:MerR family transcriptional regulator, light-induced transcriptional regulator
MNNNKPLLPSTQPPMHTGEPPFHRSGAVAHMLRMPVATLRIWERRYGLTQPKLSASGQRLYSADDVRRLALVKQLTDLGHAIGSLAPLDMQQLQRVASTHAQVLAATQKEQRPDGACLPPVPAWRLAVIGVALGARLQRPALLRQLGRPTVLLGPFASTAQAAAALQSSDLDALLIHEPQLHEDWLASFGSVAPAFAAVPKAVLYGFAADPVCDALAAAGTALLREPQPDAVLAQWLHNLSMMAVAPEPATGKAALATTTVPPRRWDDAALADFAGRSSTIACECPRHVAELLTLLSHFEAYSAECEHRNAADAGLHLYLQQLAAVSRTRFEAALEHVALHEGLMLPAPQRQNEATVALKALRPKALTAARPRH